MTNQGHGPQQDGGMLLLDCLICGLPAEVVDVHEFGSTGARVEVVRIRCVLSHHALVPAPALPTARARTTYS